MRTGENRTAYNPQPGVRGQGNGQERRQRTWGEGRGWCEARSFLEPRGNNRKLFFFFRKNNPSKMRDDEKERQGPSIFFTHYPVTEGPLLVLP